MTYRKKLIEVALPLQAINEGSKAETENPFLKGHPRAIHNWWARTPLSVSRAILFAQLMDDPGDGLPPEKANKAREKLLEFVAKLATWEATTDYKLINQAKEMVLKQFNGEAPEFWDMFAGRGSIPLEAQRLGLKVTSSDLNPVAVTIQRALLEFPPKFKDRSPVHPEEDESFLRKTKWKGTAGLAEDIRWYGEWVRVQAAKKLDKLYPKGPNNEELVAWLWARTVKCPNPACDAILPLVHSFALSTKKGKSTYIHPKIDQNNKTITWQVKIGEGIPDGTVNKKGAKCIFCKSPVAFPYIREEGKAGRISLEMISVVAQSTRQRIYYSPSLSQIITASNAKPEWVPNTDLPSRALGFRVQLYGMKKHSELFTSRQLLSLSTLCDTIGEARKRIIEDSNGNTEYANALTFYLACALSRLTDYNNSFCTWNPTNENVGHLFQRQAIPIVWDFVEANPLYGKLSYTVAADWVASSLDTIPEVFSPARVIQFDARKTPPKFNDLPVISTDPPYYDNIGYADLSDFFYTWLRSILKDIDPQTFATILSPKEPELIASPYRHDGSNDKAEQHFRAGFASAFNNMHRNTNPNVPITIYYAFKQQEAEENDSELRASTGWETMLEGLIDAGFQITGTWPVRTTKKARSVALSANALASAVVLVARPRSNLAPMATRKEFVTALRKELPQAFSTLTQTNIAPVDLAQAAIGPGIGVFSRYSKVIEADGTSMPVRAALQIINQELDAYLEAQEGDLDKDTQFCLAWYEQYSMEAAPFGEADVLARAKNTSVQGLTEAGVIHSKAGKVRLLKRDELDDDWDPASDSRLTVWECTQYLIRALEKAGEEGAAKLAAKLGGGRSDDARALAYRLYSICERKKWAQEALAYNSLVAAWLEISKLTQGQKSEKLELGL